MNILTNKNVLQYYNSAVGGCDFLTGILLILNPKLVMNLLNIKFLDSELVYLSYIGVFVLSTGFIYFVPFIHSRTNTEFLILNRSSWIASTYTRLFVSIFIITNYLLNSLDLNWLIVAFTDLSIAIFQVIILFKNKSQASNRNV